MKKTYINPSTTVVRLSAINPLATSVPQVGIDPNTTPVSGDKLDAKGMSDVNVWDNEW